MEIDLVKELKERCKKLDRTLYSKYDEYEKRGISKNGTEDDLEGINYLNAIVELIEREQLIHRTVNKSNYETKRIALENLIREANARFAVIEKYVSTKEAAIKEVEDIVENEDKEDEEVEVTKVHDGKGWLYFLGGAGLTALAIFGIKGCQKAQTPNKSLNPNPDTENVESTEDELNTTEKVNLVAPGAFGTFTDVTDKEQVEARAIYIYENYFSSFYSKLSDNERAVVTPENIANTIRVMNGELPLDKDGNVIMNANIVDDYAQMFTYLVGDLGSSPQLEGRYVNIPAYMFAVDNSAVQNFIKNYDAGYQKITDGFNKACDERLEGKEVTGGLLVREGIAEIGTRMWNEWQCQGMYGDTNPYNFDAKDRLFAYLGSFAKYGAYAFEYNMNAQQAVCIPVCIDYNTKELTEIPVNEIFVGIATGEYNTIIAKAAGINQKAEPDSVAFTQDLLDELTWKYNNVKQLKMN